MTQDHDSEFRMILSHAFLGSDTSGIDRETWDLAISGCVKYLESQFKPAPLPDDIKQWIEDEAEKAMDGRPENGEYPGWFHYVHIEQAIIESLTAMHNLLSPHIEELKAWKKSAMEIIPDMQTIAHELNLKVGESISDKILPAIKSYKERILFLESQLAEQKK